MPRATRLLSLGTLLFAGVVLIFRESDGRAEAPPGVTPPTPEPVQSVEVEHTLVTAELVAQPAASTRSIPARAARPSALRRHTAPRVALAATREKPTSLAEKTRRAILGDGRHKPQPFPRINNN